MRIPPFPDYENEDVPYALNACTCAVTDIPQFKLKGADLSQNAGTRQESVANADGVEPSQKLSSGLKVTPSLCKI